MPRKSARVGLAAEVMLRRPGKSNYRVRVFDLSADGCKLEFIERPDLGESLWVRFEGLELLEVRVRWTDGFMAGVEFQKPPASCRFSIASDKADGRGIAPKTIQPSLFVN
jgi:hypothetical protein